MRVLIVDDEPLARRGLVLRLDKIDGIEVIEQCGNGRDAIKAVADTRPDIVFLDIQMPVIDGFEVLRRIQSPSMPLVIFVDRDCDPCPGRHCGLP